MKNEAYEIIAKKLFKNISQSPNIHSILKKPSRSLDKGFCAHTCKYKATVHHQNHQKNKLKKILLYVITSIQRRGPTGTGGDLTKGLNNMQWSLMYLNHNPVTSDCNSCFYYLCLINLQH